MKTSQNWEGDNSASCASRQTNALGRFRNSLVDALVRSRVIEVPDIVFEDAPQLCLVDDQDVIEAFAPHTAQ